MWLSHFLASGVGLQKQSDWYYNKFWPVLETTTEKTERLLDINKKLRDFLELDRITVKELEDDLVSLTQRGLNLTNIAVEELTTNFAYVPTLFSDIDDAQDSLNEAMGGIANVVREQEKAVESATKSWIDYHMAIGMFQPIKDAGLPGSIEERMPSMMSPEGQMELWKGVMGLPSVGGDPAKAHAWLNSSKNPFNAGGWNAFNFPTTSGSSNVVLTNLAQINAGLKEAKVQGSQ